MKRYRLLAAAGTVLGLALTACGSIPQTGVSAPGTAASSAPPSASSVSAASSASAAGSPVWFNCLGRGQVKPADYILTCADAGSVLDHLVWTRWTAQQPVPTGFNDPKTATPTRAEGKFIDYPAFAPLWRSEPVPGPPGEPYFTRI